MLENAVARVEHTGWGGSRGGGYFQRGTFVSDLIPLKMMEDMKKIDLSSPAPSPPPRKIESNNVMVRHRKFKNRSRIKADHRNLFDGVEKAKRNKF